MRQHRILLVALLAPGWLLAGQQQNGMVVTLPAPPGAPAQSGNVQYRPVNEPPETSGMVELNAGPAVGKIALEIAEPPEEGDTISVVVTTDALKAVLVLPDGRRIGNQRSAEAAGLHWWEVPITPRLGSADGGHSTAIDFMERGAAGRYVVELSARDLKKAETAQAHFISRRKQYFEEMHELPGVLLPPAAALTPSAVIAIDLDRDEKGAMFDIVVPDSTVKVSLTLPDGRTLRPGQKLGRETEWKTVAKREDIDPGGSWFGISGFLLPLQGPHHVISFETAAKGRYEIQATGSKGGELHAAFIPFGRAAESTQTEMHSPPRVAPGEVRLEPVALPNYCRAGDKLELEFSVLGDVQPGSLRFEVKVELRRELPYSGRGPHEFGAPQLETVPVSFTRDQNEHYRGTITAKAGGLMRVGLGASGKKPSGEPFSEEILLAEIAVSEPPPTVARFLSLNTNPVDTNGNGTFDRLDVTALLDVVAPGEYGMSFRIADRADTGSVVSDCRAKLKAGRGKIETSIPARKIRHELKNGPYRILELKIYRVKGDYGDDVEIGTKSFQTADLELDQWEPDPIFGDEQVTLRGIRPAVSGRFRFAEVEWNVTTPGGECYWNASLAPASGGRGTDLHVESKLAAGRTALRLVFPAADLARAGNREALFHAMVSCYGVNEGGVSPFLKLAVDPAQFEPPRGSLEIIPQSMLRLPPGGSGSVLLDVPGKKLGDVRFSFTDVPPEATAVFDTHLVAAQGDRVAQGWAEVRVQPKARPGRYFLGVNAVSAGETAEGEIVLDVVP